MAAISATILSVAFLIAALIGVDRDAPVWFSATSLVLSGIIAIVILSAIGADTAAAAAARRPFRQSPSSN